MSLRFGLTRDTDRPHLYSDSVRVLEDGSLEFWKDRAAFPLIELTSDVYPIGSNYLLWELLYESGAKVALCSRCPRPPHDHIIGFRLGHPPTTVVTHGQPVTSDLVPDGCQAVDGVQYHPIIRYSQLESDSGQTNGKYKLFLNCNSHFHDNQRFILRVTLVQHGPDGSFTHPPVSVLSPPIRVVSKFLKPKPGSGPAGLVLKRRHSREDLEELRPPSPATPTALTPPSEELEDRLSRQALIEQRVKKIPRLAVGQRSPRASMELSMDAVPVAAPPPEVADADACRGALRVPPALRRDVSFAPAPAPEGMDTDLLTTAPVADILVSAVQLMSPIEPVNGFSTTPVGSALRDFMLMEPALFEAPKDVTAAVTHTALFDALDGLNMDAPIAHPSNTPRGPPKDMPPPDDGSEATVHALFAPPAPVPMQREERATISRIVNCAKLFYTLSSDEQRVFFRQVCDALPAYTLLEQGGANHIVAHEQPPMPPTLASTAAPSPFGTSQFLVTSPGPTAPLFDSSSMLAQTPMRTSSLDDPLLNL